MNLEQLKTIWENFKHMPAIDEGIGQIYISPMAQALTVEIVDYIDKPVFETLVERGKAEGLNKVQICTEHGKATVILSNQIEGKLGSHGEGWPIYAPLENPMTTEEVIASEDECFDKRDFEKPPRFKEQQLDEQQKAHAEKES